MRRRGAVQGERGATAVEFALVLPLLVLLVFGTVEFARAYHTLVTLTHAAREGVRVLAIEQDGTKAAEATRTAATSLPPESLSVTTGDCDPGNPAEVIASFPFSYHVPLLGGGTVTLTGKGVMRCGG